MIKRVKQDMLLLAVVVVLIVSGATLIGLASSTAAGCGKMVPYNSETDAGRNVHNEPISTTPE